MKMKCTGPNEAHAAACEERAEAYSILSKFYRLDLAKQKAFAAYFEALLENAEAPAVKPGLPRYRNGSNR